MCIEDFNQLFSRRLRYYLDMYDMTQADLAKKLGVGTTSVSNWVNGVKTPRMGKVDAMCRIFHCSRSDLIADSVNPEKENQYYIDDDARELAEFLHKNPDYKVLFDASKKVKPEDIEFVREMIDRMTGGDADG